MKKILYTGVQLIFFYFLIANPLYAQNEKLKCNNNTGINTAIGCVPVNDENALLEFLLGWFIGIAGGIAILLIIYAGIQIMTSSGNPEKIGAGKELLTAAIGGIVLLIFSVFILRLFGVEILKLPGF